MFKRKPREYSVKNPVLDYYRTMWRVAIFFIIVLIVLDLFTHYYR